MKKIKFILPALSLLVIPCVTIACKRPDWEEPIKNNNQENQEEKNNSIAFESSPVNNLYSKYNGDVQKVFVDLKRNYRHYHQKFSTLKRNYLILKNKLTQLSNEQSIEENRNTIRSFISKWLDIKSNQDVNLFSLFLSKYTLIFQDIEAVMVDINLAFESKEFLKHLKVIDDRLLGKDINLSLLQNSVNSAWIFLKQNVLDYNKLTTIENLNNINLDGDKNSHGHSHALLNMLNEISLWHIKMIEYQKQYYTEFKNDFQSMTNSIVDNINHIDVLQNFNYIDQVFINEIEYNPTESLITNATLEATNDMLNEIKTMLLNIGKSQGLKENDLLK